MCLCGEFALFKTTVFNLNQYNELVQLNKKLNSNKRCSGFTLVEVLIASVILFSAIAIGSLSLRMALNQLRRVSYHTSTATAVLFVKEQVKEQIKNQKVDGKGEWGKELTYQWRAERFKSAANTYGESILGGAQPGEFRLTLYKVNVVFKSKIDPAFKPRTFQYKELTYRKLSGSEALEQ